MSLGTILLIILILILFGAIPAWPHSRAWGGGPATFIAIIVVIVLAMLLTGRF